MSSELRSEAHGEGDGTLRAELARLAPGPAVPELSSGRHQLLKEELMREIRRDRAREARPARPGRRRWKFAVVPAVAAAVAAAIVVGVTATDDASDRPAVSAAGDDAATRLLIQAAATAEKKQSTPVRDDQYMYVQYVEQAGVITGSGDDVGFHLAPSYTAEFWMPVTGTGETLRRTDGTSERKDTASTADGDLRLPGYRFLETLPTDPDQLLAYLRKEAPRYGDNPRDQQVFDLIGDVLRHSVLPPQLTGALFRAAAKIPGVTTVRGVTDALGRPGVAIGMTQVQETHTQLIFDERTTEFIGERTVLAKDGPLGAKGMPMSNMAVVRHGVADSLGGAPVSSTAPVTMGTPGA